MDRWQRLDAAIGRVEQLLVVVMLSFMILLAFLQIVLRNFFDTGLAWSDALVRYLVVWLGFIGAALATREGRHITIDLFARRLRGVTGRIVACGSRLVCAGVCGLLCLAAVKFLRNEAQLGGVAFWGIAGWIPQTIIPTAFGIMTLRFGLGAYRALVDKTTPGTVNEPFL
jgi:TRAP-type C4-dicarboxylate transport system permease small subunit